MASKPKTAQPAKPNPRLVPVLRYRNADLVREVYILHPGDNFPRFGGSSGGLTVVKTPSLIIREIGPWGTTDTECDTFNTEVWSRIAKGLIAAGGQNHIPFKDIQAMKEQAALNPNIRQKDYLAMELWLRSSGSFTSYIEQQQSLAMADGAPLDALYQRDGDWVCMTNLDADHPFRAQYQAMMDDYWLNGTPEVRAALESLHTAHWNRGNKA